MLFNNLIRDIFKDLISIVVIREKNRGEREKEKKNYACEYKCMACVLILGLEPPAMVRLEPN